MPAKKKQTLNDLKLCVDRPIPLPSAFDAAMTALSENRENEPPPLISRPGMVTHPLSMALETKKKWANARKVGVKFLDGTKNQKMQTQKYAEEWEQFANINFDFSAGAKAEVRISFKEQGSWSALGTDCLLLKWFPKSKPTMNYGWLEDHSPEDEWRRVVLHEFGHALGAIHEHQNPQGGIQWNLQQVYSVFGGAPNSWSKEQVDFNIVQKYAVDHVNASTFDADSIMLYAFPAALIVGGKATKNNNAVSKGDKSFIGEMYPKAKKPGVAAAPRRLGIAGGETIQPVQSGHTVGEVVSTAFSEVKNRLQSSFS